LLSASPFIVYSQRFSPPLSQLNETKNKERKWTLRKLDASEAANAQLSAAEQTQHDADYEVRFRPFVYTTFTSL